MGSAEIQLVLHCSHRNSQGEEGLVGAGAQSWGDPMVGSSENMLRVVFLNIGGFALDSKDVKNKRIFEFLRATKADVAGLMECNVNWKLLDIQD